MAQWRLILSGSDNGAWNMALDEALLESCAAHASLPTLRFYSWNPPCLSLGYAQPASDMDQTKLREFGWDLVRRPTGGRAILHTDELTYSITASQDEPLVEGSILESYCRLSQALLAGLELLGISAKANRKTTGGERDTKPVCFETPSDYEITVAGKKVIGSAQARRSKGVLQHGAIPLQGDMSRINQVLTFDNESDRDEANLRLAEHATTLFGILHREVPLDLAQRMFTKAFQNIFKLELIKESPTEKELVRARELVHQKYSNSEWILRL